MNLIDLCLCIYYISMYIRHAYLFIILICKVVVGLLSIYEVTLDSKVVFGNCANLL